jgi:hypothetical protein
LLTPLIEALRQNPELVELSRKVGLGHLFGSFSGGKTKQSPKSQIIHDFFAAFDKLSNDNKITLDMMVKKLAPAFLSTSSLARRKTAKTR